MSARDRIVIGVLAAVVAVAGLWFAVLAPKRKAIAAADDRIAAQQQRLDQAQSVLVTAEGAKRRYAADSAAVARLGKAVPADDNMASLVYELQAVAEGAKVKFRSIKLGGSSSAAAKPAPAAGTGTSAPAAGGTGSPAPATGTGTTPAPATQVAASQLPPGATVGTAGLATLPFSFVFEGSFLDMQRFLGHVDRFVHVRGDNILVSGRLLTIDGISLANGADGSTIKASIAATAYLAPGDGTTASGATPAAPGAAPSTATPAGTGGATSPTTSSAVTAAPAS